MPLRELTHRGETLRLPSPPPEAPDDPLRSLTRDEVLKCKHAFALYDRDGNKLRAKRRAQTSFLFAVVF
jgi:hypothetical protein